MPCDMSKYPKNWRQTRKRILERAGNKCEQCDIPNHSYGFRFTVDETDPHTGRQYKAGDFYLLGTDYKDSLNQDRMIAESAGYKIIEIVCTVAHLIEDGPIDCSDLDLKLLCQRCHNRLDARMRARHRKSKWFGQKAVAPLFEVTNLTQKAGV